MKKEQASLFPLCSCSQAACPGAGSIGMREAENRLGKFWRVVYLSDAVIVKGMRWE